MSRQSTRTIRLAGHIPDGQVAALKGTYLDRQHYDELIGGSESVNVYKPDGSPLLLFRPGRLSLDVCEMAWPVLRKVGSNKSGKRGFNTGILGYYSDDNGPRVAKFTEEYPEESAKCLPLVWALNSVFRRDLPTHYLRQRKVAKATSRDWLFDWTVMTTLSTNRWNSYGHDARTPVHADTGNLREGFGLMTVMTLGDFHGGHVVFPKYGVAVRLRTGDVLLSDINELHGNVAIQGNCFERIAAIAYFRAGLRYCPGK